MQLRTNMAVINTAASATQALPDGLVAAQVLSVTGLAGGATSVAATNYAVVTGAPAAGDVQFTGTPAAPSGTLTFNAALTANGVLLVVFTAPGDVPADQ